MRHPIFGSILALTIAAPAGAQVIPVDRVAQSPAVRAAIDTVRSRIAADVAADNVGGITAAVVVGGRVVWAEGFGWADRERKIAAGPQTIYRIGSISKSFTALALAQLVDRGVVRLDDPVERYLPEVHGFTNARAGAKPITLRQLASHTAGLIREPRLADAASGPIAQWENKILASIPATSFDTLPGARYAYSNIGYGVLGLTISRAAKTPFMQLVEEGIFKPLGMSSSTFVVSPALQPQLSTGYANGPNGIDSAVPTREHLGRGYKVPNGGIYSTVGDLARFIGAMVGDGKRVVSDDMRREMLRVQTPERRPGGYGLGFQLSGADTAIQIAGHGGSVAGYTAHIAFDRRSGIGVVLLRNYGQGRTNLQSAANQLVTNLTRSAAASR
jgi:CubicO group peptidase (beta-lactamase class C family)